MAHVFINEGGSKFESAMYICMYVCIYVCMHMYICTYKNMYVFYFLHHIDRGFGNGAFFLSLHWNWNEPFYDFVIRKIPAHGGSRVSTSWNVSTSNPDFHLEKFSDIFIRALHQGCQIFHYTIYQNGGKFYQITNGHKIYQIAVIYPKLPLITHTNIFDYKALQNLPKFGFLLSKSGNPALRSSQKIRF
jgi:hypothetical protein